MQFEPFRRNYVHRYVSVVLIRVQYKVSAIYFITDCSLINPAIAARPPQNLANPVHTSTKTHIFDFDPYPQNSVENV